MTAAVIAAMGVLLAVLALATYVVTLVRTAERERAAALQLAEKLQGEVNLANERAAREISRLAGDVRRSKRRADALEDYLRSDIMRRHGVVDDGLDLLLAEIGVIADGTDDEADTNPGAARDRAGTSGTVFVDPARHPAVAGGAEGAGVDVDVSEGETP